MLDYRLFRAPISRRPDLLTALALVAVLAACGDVADQTSETDATTTTSASASASPQVESASPRPISPPDAASASPGGESTVAAPPADDLVVLEAYWMCDVQRFGFADLDEMQAELDARLESASFTADAYAEFGAQLESEPVLREQVLSVYRTYCDDADSAEG